MSSIFTRIVRRDAPAERLFETPLELAFLDIHPKSPGHTLVVPKLEVASFEELPENRAGSLVRTMQVVAQGIVRAMGTANYNLVLNNGAAAGQVVFHVHFHIIPRYGGTSSLGGASSASLAETGERIRRALRELPAERLRGGWIPEPE
jgi:histidine triad (HIT) family protein